MIRGSYSAHARIVPEMHGQPDVTGRKIIVQNRLAPAPIIPLDVETVGLRYLGEASERFQV